MKQKKKRNGFVCSIVQAAIYTFLALAMAAMSLYFVASIPNSFISYLNNEYDEGEMFSVSSSGEDSLKNSGILDDYYENYERIYFNGYLVLQDEPYLLIELRARDEHYNDIFKEEIILDFYGNNKDGEYFSFRHADSGINVNIAYNQIGGYTDFKFYHDEDVGWAALFGGLGGAMLVFAILQFIVAFCGKKSIHANNFGIALNSLFFLGIIGIPGFVGAIKGRKYLKLKAKGNDESAKEVSSSDTVNESLYVKANSGSTENSTVNIVASANADSAEYEKIEKIELEDASIHEKEWKTFKKSASQEELFLLGIGTKYRLRTGFIKSVIFAIGIVLSIVIGMSLMAVDISAALIILVVGHLVFSFLSTKHIRYKDTFRQIKGKLKGEYKEQLKKVLNYPAWMSIIDVFLEFALLWLTIPYQALMLAIGMVAPDFVVSKNGVLVSVPKGYGLDNLIAMGEYYKRTSLLDELTDTWWSQKKEYTFTNDYGNQQTVYSSDGKNFYDAGGAYVASSNDGGKTLEFPNSNSTDDE